MNDIEVWFDRAAQREDRAVSLYTKLLTGRVFSYFGYRLRYSLLLTSVRFIVHAVEFFILLDSLGGLATVVVMVLRIGTVIIGGGWWGLLEVMRERIRSFARSGHREESEREIGRWLILSVALAVIVTVIGGIVLLHVYPAGSARIPQLYAFLIILELGVNFPVRVVHDGIFATRRVYRPLWTMFAPIAIQLAVLTCGFYLYPTAAIIIAIIASNAIGIWFTVHYSVEVYRLTGIRPSYGKPTLAFWRLLPRIPAWFGLKATISGLGLRMDGLLVLGIVGVYGTDSRTFDLTAGVAAWGRVDAFQFFYLILPLLRGAFGGAGVFYFDFVRLRSIPALREFQLSFFYKVLGVAPVIALFFWCQATVLGVFVLRDIPLGFLLALLPLFVVRSLVGTYLYRLFADGRMGTHIGSMLFLSLLLWLVWINPDPASDLIEITAAMITELIFLINVQHLRDRRDPPLPPLVPLGDWLRTLSCETGPLVVGRIGIPDSITSQQKSAATHLMQKRYGGKGHFAFSAATKVVYYERADNNVGRQQPHLELQRLTGGAINRGQLLQAGTESGRGALNGLISAGWIRPPEGQPGPDTPETLSSTFHALFPDGIALDTESSAGKEEMRGVDHDLLATVIPTAIKCLEDGTHIIFTSGRWLTPIYHRGTLRMVFILPAEADSALVKAWMAVVRDWQICSGTTEISVGAGLG